MEAAAKSNLKKACIASAFFNLSRLLAGAERCRWNSGASRLTWCSSPPTWTKVGTHMQGPGTAPHDLTRARASLTAANWAALGIFYNTGQDCTAGSRVYVQDTVYDKFVALLLEKAKTMVISHGFDESAGGGPVVSAVRAVRGDVCYMNLAGVMQVSKTQHERVWSYIESGKSQGAKVLFGGEKRSGRGYWVDPTSARRRLCCSGR